MDIAATLFDSIRAFLISSTVPMATGTINGDIGLDGREGGVLTVLLCGGLTTGTKVGSFATLAGGGPGVAGAGLTSDLSGNFGPFSGPALNGKITGANFLFVMPTGISPILNFGVFLGSSVNVLSLSESISNESSVLSSKISLSLMSGRVSQYGGSTFLYGVPGL